MPELRNARGPIDEVEALVLAAGRYVRASDDLRPRVLEMARVEQSERRARRWIARAAAAVVLIMGVAASYVHWLRSEDAFRRFALSTPERQGQRVQAGMGGSEVGWGIVEAFTELRENQTEVLAPAL